MGGATHMGGTWLCEKILQSITTNTDVTRASHSAGDCSDPRESS